MSVDNGLVEWVTEALAPMGTVSMRRMMGGATLYLDGTIFAIAHEGELYFKADAQSNALWDDAGCARFTYQMSEGRSLSMNYRRAPEDVDDDPESLREWASHAIAAGQRGPVKKPRKRKVKPADS